MNDKYIKQIEAQAKEIAELKRAILILERNMKKMMPVQKRVSENVRMLQGDVYNIKGIITRNK